MSGALPRHDGGPSRAGDVFRAIGAGIVLLAVVAGMPLALAYLIGWPLPRELPSVGEIVEALRGPNDLVFDEVIVKTLAVLAWMYWLHFILCVLVELVAAMRGRSAGRMPLGGVNQEVASRLVAAVLVLMPGQGALGAAAAASLPLGGVLDRPIAVSAPLVPGQGVERAQAVTVVHGSGGGLLGSGQAVEQLPRVEAADLEEPSTANVAQEQAERPARAVRKSVVVQRGDNLWDLAGAHLPKKGAHASAGGKVECDPFRWREIYELNRDRRQADGRRLVDEDLILPGWVLVMPADAIGVREEPRQTPAARPSQPDRPQESEAPGQGDSNGEAAQGEGLADVPAPPGAAPTSTAPTTGTATTAPPTTVPPSTAPPTTQTPTTQTPTTTKPPSPSRAAPTTAPRDPAQSNAPLNPVFPPLPGAPGQGGEDGGGDRNGAGPTTTTKKPGGSPTTTTQPREGGGVVPNLPGAPGGTNGTGPGGGGGGGTPPTRTSERPGTTVPSTSQTPPATRAPEREGRDPLAGSVAAAERGDQARPGWLQSAPWIAGGGLLAAGVLYLITRRRKAQQRRRRNGHHVPLPTPQAAEAELDLRAAELPELAELLDLGLKAMAAGLARDRLQVPPVLGVVAGAQSLQVLLAEPCAGVPVPFETTLSRRRWMLGLDIPKAELTGLAGDTPAPLPALVTIGVSDAGHVLLNLESLGFVGLAGDLDAARGLLNAMAIEFATSSWTDFVEIYLVGFGEELASLERIRVSLRLEDVLPRLEQQAREVGRALDDGGHRSMLKARLDGATVDTWVPAVVLCAEPPSPEARRRLESLTADPARSPIVAVAVAVGDDGVMAGTKWTFTLPEEPKALMRVPPLGLDVQPLRLEGDDYASIVKLLRPEPSAEDARLPARYPAVDEKAADDALDDAGPFDHGAGDAVGGALGLGDAVDASVEVVDGGAGRQDDAAASADHALPEAEDWRSAARREAMLRLSSAGPPPDVPIDRRDATGRESRLPLPSGQLPVGGGTDTGSGTGMPSADPARAERSSALRAGERAGPDPEVQADVEVRVLGRVEVGGIGRIERGKSEELIVFLALHPEGVDGDRISDALWRGVPPAKATLNTTTTVARNSLGALDDGSLRLPHARNGVYRLDPSVGLDWARFQALVTRAESKGAGGSADLRLALELVRGRPFEGVRPRTYGWALLDLAAVMEAAVVDAADRLAELRLDDGDAPGAQWAARRGLKISPYDERLYRRLMLAADLAGNPAGVEAVMEELLKRLDDDSFEPWDAIHEETRTLYERLRGARQGTPPGARRRA